ncbi:hypothetical protein GLOIN_2v1881283 [Rhizophagus irregularis DAOM 181602=DAOM 197198]|nr:hypothetical protein GLOIN_2v1881283 [Rhizophagus irregularis DAOM 181602=DAOM 197198]
MACSKLFSGDLPELINEIIQYFHYDYKTLHSCIFVNRLWCRLAIPLLWEDPFSIKFPKNYYFIEIYLNNLNDDDKVKLNEYIIHNELFPLNTLFNYPRFIKHLDAYKVSNSIEKWVKTIMNSTIKEQHSNYSITNANLSLSQIIKLIFWSLILLFIKNEANLHSFKVTTCIGYSNEIIELILQNRNFIYNIKNLALKLDKANDNIIKFLEFLCSNCNSISSLYFPLPSYNNYPIIEKYLSQIIKSQENLKKISFGYGYGCSLYHPLLSLNNLNCSNTLNTIIFYYINFKNINVLSEVFNQLNVLESIHIVYCYHLDSKFIQQINNIIKPFKLKSLFLDGVNYELLEPLMQKSGQILPFKLEYLNLCLNLINTNDLRFFLKNSQNIFIKKLLIKNTMNENCQNNIFPYIKEYIMKKKRIKYLAIREILCSKSEDLFFSKDKVKEFELYGIQVLNYDDFVIDIYSFIIETY